ncbi:MAG: hypothetical protein M1834_001419 [Cirrosporium novae-zelandiae]|nr:MAG: hypothetical protein M1834_001419 [Cirrosporium novae-zelandiae]
MFVGQSVAVAGASILDMTESENYEMFLSSLSEQASLTVNGRLGASAGECVIQGLSNDSLAVMSTRSDNAVISYNFTYEATSLVLYCTTGGWGSGPLATQNVASGFQIHVPETSIKASIWAIDDHGQNQLRRFATFRFANGSHSVLPFEFEPSTENEYTSNSTGITYPTQWILRFLSYGSIDVSSIRPGQEMYNTSSPASPAYEDFSDLNFTMFSHKKREFGLTEVVSYS